MPGTTFTLPADNHVDNDPGHTTDHNAIVDALYAGTQFIITNTEWGGDATGVADSTAAVIAAMNAAGNAVGLGNVEIVFPPGTYTCNAGQIPGATGLSLRGAGYMLAVINCTYSGSNGYLFNMDPPGYSNTVHIEDMRITGLQIVCQNADIFWGSNCVRCRVEDNWLHQKSAGFAVWNVQNGTGTNNVGYMAECYFANKEYIDGGTRTIEAWHLDFSYTYGPGGTLSSMSCNDNTWARGNGKIWSSNGGDTSMYWMKLLGSQAGSYGSKHNTWRDLLFEIPSGTGGFIHCLNTEHILIENISSEDLSGNNVGNPLLLFNTVSGGAEGCKFVTIRNYSCRSGSNISNTNPHIKFDSNSSDIDIIDPSQSSGGTQLTIDFGNAVSWSRSGNWPSSYTLLNAGNIAPARASFAPASPTGTTSSSKVMMGLGSGAAFTPQGSGQVMAIFTGAFRNTGSTGAGTVGGRYGTGTAPANAAAGTGTQWGGNADQTLLCAGTSGGVGFTLVAILSLTAGTAYWFDLAVSSNGTATAQPQALGLTLQELN